MDNTTYWWIIFGVDFLLYGICCLMILKRKNFTVISIRSPKLLLFTILGNFFMSLLLILGRIIDNSDLNYFSSFFYLFRFLMIVSMLLRYERIIISCGIKKNDAADMQQFFTNRNMYLEKYYIRILVIVFSIVLLIIIIISIVWHLCEEFFTNDKNKELLIIIKLYISVIWNFIELIVIITYLYRTYEIISPKQFVKFELYIFLILWIGYNNFISLCKLEIIALDDTIITIVSIAVLYFSLLLNGYLPVIISFTSKTLVQYHFTFKLMNNLYLFLTDETCYQCFNNYLIKRKDNGSFFLKLYTHIMKYKLDFVLNASDEQHFSSAVVINNTYFENENDDKIDPVVFNRVKSECKALLDNNRFDKNQFDAALKYCYDELNIRFNEFKNSRQYNELYANITLTSYIKCKMCNIGMINKY